MLDFYAEGRGFDPQPGQKVISIFPPVTSVGNQTGIHYRQSESLNRLIIDSTIENYGTSMCMLMAKFLFISEVHVYLTDWIRL